MNKNKKYDYDLIIIGSGAGGGVAAHQANKAGLSVAIVETGQLGGECPNVACVPTKALLHAARVYETAKNGSKFGIRGSTVSYNYPSVKAWKDLAVERTGVNLGEKMYVDEGINVIHGSAHFLDKNTITVGRARFSAKYFIIATGAKTAIPKIEGLQKSGYLTYENAINLNRPPKSLAIIGGGAVGCEFAQLFAIFGTKVYLIESTSRLLKKEDKEAGEFLIKRFESEYSASVHLSTRVEKVELFADKKRLFIKDSKTAEVKRLTVDEILIATGKKAAIDIGLNNAGVKDKDGLIAVNRYMQTTSENIYAAGDCVGPYQLTHMATYQSKIAIHNILYSRKKMSAKYNAVPRCVFTNPEIASVGLTEAELRSKQISFTKVIVPINVIGRANTADENDGFVKVIASSKTGALLSATIASPQAGEMIHELAVAIENRLKASQVASTSHAFPPWSDAVRVACAKLSK